MLRRATLGTLLAAVLLVAGCGQDTSDLISAASAQELVALVDAAGQASAAGDCAAAEDAVARARTRAGNLSDRVDAELKANLRAWLRHLGDAVQAECGADAEPSPTPTPTPTPSPTPTPTASPSPTPTPTETPAPTPTPTETATPAPTSPPDVDPGALPTEPEGTGGVPDGEDTP